MGVEDGAPDALGVQLARELGTGHDQRRGAVRGGADVQLAQRVGDDRAGQHVLDRSLLVVAGIRVVQAVLRVLHLDLGEVLGGGAVQVHSAAGQEGEVHRVHRAQQVEALPVGVVLALAADGCERALRRGVGTDDQCDVAEAGQDVGAGALQRLRTTGARGVRRGHRHAVPAQLLGERRTGDEAGVTVADGVSAGNQLDLTPVQAGLGQRRAGGDDAVLGEVAAPLAPRVHAGTEDVHRCRSPRTHFAISQA